jgi:hypothetical protein
MRLDSVIFFVEDHEMHLKAGGRQVHGHPPEMKKESQEYETAAIIRPQEGKNTHKLCVPAVRA